MSILVTLSLSTMELASILIRRVVDSNSCSTCAVKLALQQANLILHVARHHRRVSFLNDCQGLCQTWGRIMGEWVLVNELCNNEETHCLKWGSGTERNWPRGQLLSMLDTMLRVS